MDTPAAIEEPTAVSAAEAAARHWAGAGHEVTLQGTVVHSHASRTVALYAATAALLSLVGVHRPDLALVGLVITGLSAVADLDGGHGWLRLLRPRHPAHNVVVWPKEGHGPVLLVAAALDPHVPTSRVPHWVLRIPLFLIGLGLLGCVVSDRDPEVARATLITAALCLSLVSIIAIGWRLLARETLVDNPARAAVELAITQVERADLKHLRCAFALIGQAIDHHDGLETLLKNHRHRLRQDATRVLVLHPDQDILGAVHHEGRIRRRRSDALLVETMRRLGLAGRTLTTAASRAQRTGWRAAAMTVGQDQVHAAALVITRMAQEFDEDLLAREAAE